MAATWDQKPVPDYTAAASPQPGTPNPYPQQQQQSPAGQPQQQYYQQPMQQQPMQQAGPGQPQPVYMQNLPQGQPQGQPIAQPGGQRGYQTSTPLASLGRGAAPVDCPACGHRAMTRITFVTGNYTHGWAGLLFLATCCLCWLPYVMDGFKNVDHNCGQCGVLLATWHKSGGTDVHQHV